MIQTCFLIILSKNSKFRNQLLECRASGYMPNKLSLNTEKTALWYFVFHSPPRRIVHKFNLSISNMSAKSDTQVKYLKLLLLNSPSFYRISDTWINWSCYPPQCSPGAITTIIFFHLPGVHSYNTRLEHKFTLTYLVRTKELWKSTLTASNTQHKVRIKSKLLQTIYSNQHWETNVFL